MQQEREFLVAQHGEKRLLDVLADHVLRLALENDRIGQPVRSEPQNVILERRREQERLAFSLLRQLRHDPLHVRNKPHVEHAVRLVDDQNLDLRKIEVSAARIIDDAPRGADDEIDRLPQGTALLLMVHAAEYDDAGQPGEDAERFGILMDLHRKLAGRRQYEGTRPARLAVTLRRIVQEARESRQQERGRLAGSGLRLAGQVAPLKQRRKRQRLDRGAIFESGVLHAVLDLFMQRQIEKPHLALRRRNLFERGGMLRLRGLRRIRGLDLNRAFGTFALRAALAFRAGGRCDAPLSVAGPFPRFFPLLLPLPAGRLFPGGARLLLLLRLFRSRFDFHDDLMLLIDSEQDFQSFLQFLQHVTLLSSGCLRMVGAPHRFLTTSFRYAANASRNSGRRSPNSTVPVRNPSLLPRS